MQYPEDTAESRTQYTYDNMYRLATTTAQVEGQALSASYTYEDDYLTSLQTGSTTYSFAYGAFGLRENIKIGSRTLAAYTYTSRNNQLAALDYGNGDKVEYTYDTQGRITQETYENGDTVSYRYDNSGALATVTDSATGRTTTYYYDFTDRLMNTVEQGTDFCHSLGYEYDSINNLTTLVNTINGVALETSYSYDLDNRITGQTQGDTTLSYHYDGYSRLNQVRTKHTDTTLLIHSYEFRRPTSGATTGQVEKHTIGTTRVMTRYSYTYDDNGNILSVSDGTNTTSYAYDTANQLIRENNQAAGKTTTWTYDNAGNILTRSEYAYTTAENPGTPTDTVNYTYGDESWGDLLTAYDGVAITYDQIGNPLTDGTYTYTWEHGRQLRSISDGTTTWTYTYDASGLRTSASNGTVTDQYVYTGGQLTMMRKNGIYFYFTYDANGSPCTISYGTNTFYYVTNLQGDVIALLDSSGATAAQYTYDAWGNPLTVTGPHLVMAEYNPLRYRGYVYDTATGLYYLQSRYYNPEIGRFLNADGFTSTGQGLTGNNMFAYCLNNPVMLLDSQGYSVTAAKVIAILAEATISALMEYIKTESIDSAISAFIGSVLDGCLTSIVKIPYFNDAVTSALYSVVEYWESGADLASIVGAGVSGFLSGISLGKNTDTLTEIVTILTVDLGLDISGNMVEMLITRGDKITLDMLIESYLNGHMDDEMNRFIKANTYSTAVYFCAASYAMGGGNGAITFTQWMPVKVCMSPY